MNRRELIKALPSVLAVPFMVGKSKVNAYPLDRKGTYLYFIDRKQLDIEEFCNLPSGGDTRYWIPPGMVYAVDDPETAIRIYKVSDD